MARIIVTAPADADMADIFADLYNGAGPVTAEKFNTRFDRLYERLANHPESCPLRPKLGPHIRIGLVLPYVVIYRHVEGADVVTIIRIVHGRRQLTRKLVQGES